MAVESLRYNRSNGAERWDLELSEVPIAPPMAGELFLYIPFPNGRVQTYALPETFSRVQKLDSAAKAKTRQFLQDLRTKLQATDVSTGTGGDPRSIGGETLRGAPRLPTNLRERTATNVSASLANRGEARRLIDRVPKHQKSRCWSIPVHLVFAPVFPVTINSVGVLITGTDKEALLLRRDPQNPVFRFTTDSPMSLPPIEFGNHAYVTLADSTVQSVDLVAGLTNWRFAAGSPLTDQPVVTEDSVFLQTANRGVIRVDRKTGASIWQQSDATQFQAVNEKFVYGTDRFGKLLVLDRQSGAILSRYDLSAFNAMFANHQTDRLILAANDGSIISLRDKSQVQPLEHRAKPAPAKTAVPADKKADDPPK